MITLRAGSATATVVPDAGGRVGSIAVDGVELLVTGAPGDHPMLWGSFPMAPWAGRIRDARFTHEGETIELPASLPPHAGHGLVYDRAWARTDPAEDPTACALATEIAWPLGGHAEQRFVLTPHELRCTLVVEAAGRSMPAEVGWHPWFRTGGPIDLRAAAMYERVDALPTGRLVAPAPPPWDDCFVTSEPVGVPVDGLTVAVGGDVDHVVVFDELDLGVAVEPQSGPPDAFHLRPRILAPHTRLERTMTVAWRKTLRTSR